MFTNARSPQSRTLRDLHAHRLFPFLFLAAALVALLALVVYFAGDAPPAQGSSHVLVSNLGQTNSVGTYQSTTVSIAQGFATGSQTGGYALGSIEVYLNSGADETERDQIEAELWSHDSNGGPDSKLYDLTVPAHPIAAGTVTFTAPANTTLSASTNYYIVVYTNGTYNFPLRGTTSDNEDSGGAAGWSIQNDAYVGTGDTPSPSSTWSTRNTPVKIAVNGPEASLDPTDLSALAVESSTDGNNFAALSGASALVPAFSASTTTYRATVGNPVTHVRLTPTVAVTGSTVQVGKSGSLATVASGSASDPIALSVGDNEFIVRVTASDNSTQDYTVTITRQGAAGSFLVSNVGQTAETTARTTNNAVQAQGFGTGHHTAGYTLSSVEAVIGAAPTSAQRDQIRAELWSWNNVPGEKLYDLTVPAHPITAGPVSFGASEEITLDNNTTYYFVLYTTGTFDLQLSSTMSDGEDAGAQPGWTVLDLFHTVQTVQTPGTSPTWTLRSATGAALQIRVQGEAVSAARDLSNLIVWGTEDITFSTLRRASALAPAFDAGITTYRATVGNDVTEVAFEPLLADASSTVQVGRKDGALSQVTSAVSRDFTLAVGDNDFTVRVTDTNGNTKDYTVTVRRVPAGTEWWATLVPGESAIGGLAVVGCVTGTECDSHLTDNDFTIGAANELAVVAYYPSTGNLLVHGSEPAHVQLQNLKFCAGPTEFSIASSRFFISSEPLTPGWTAGAPVSLSIGTSCAPPPPVTLVSTLGQPAVSGGALKIRANIVAQGFTTGISGGGYTLTSVVVNVIEHNQHVTADNTRAELWSANPDGGPLSKLADLVVPSAIPAGEISIQAPAGTTLEPRTNYYVLFYTTTIGHNWLIGITHSTHEDTGGAAGWSIADRHWRAAGSDSDSVSTWTIYRDIDYPQRRGIPLMSLQGTAHGEPAAPTPANLQAEPGGGKVTLSWEITRAPGDSTRSRYNIEYGEHPDGPLTLARTGAFYATAPSYAIEGLTPGTTYRFRVQTAGTFGFGIDPSPWSDWITATPVAPPSPPTDLTVAPGNRELALSWTAPAGTLTGYDVHYTASATVAADARGGSGNNPATGWVAIRRGTETNPPTASQTISDLTNLTTYRVRVRARDATGQSAWVHSTGMPYFPTPTGLKVVPGNARLTVSWTAPPVALTGYDVQHKLPGAPDRVATTVGDPSTGWVGASHPATTTTVTIGLQTLDRLTNNTTYVVRVRAKDAAGHSAWVEAGGTPKATITGSSDATLSALVLTDTTDTSVAFDLTPGFESAKYAYTAAVIAGQRAVKVTLGVNEANATATVNGTAVTSGTPSDDIDLAVGANRITVRVTAQNGATQDYTLDVTRALPPVKWPGNSGGVEEGGSTPIRVQVGSYDMSGTLTYAAGATNPASPTADLPGDHPTTFTKSATDSDPYVLIPLTSYDDALNEEHETYTITINPGIGYVVGSRPTLTVTITDNDPPAAPGDLSLRARDGALNASWARPAGPVTGYKVRWKATAAADRAATTVGNPATGWVEGSEVTATSQQITGLTNDTSYDVQVRATDGQTETGNGYGPWSASQSEMPMLSPDADLSALAAESSADGNTFAALTLDQTFAPGATAYTATVDHEVTHARLTPTLSDSNASVQVGKGTTLETVASGTASNAVALEVGANAITVRVTAQDGNTTQDYTVTVTRRRSSDAMLSGLTASGNDGGVFLPLTLSPAFDPAVTAYTVSVPNSTNRVRLTPTVNHSGATVQVGKRANLQSVTSGTASNSVALEVGTTAVIARVTAQNGATRNYTVTVTRRMDPRVSLAARPNPVQEESQVTIEAKLSDLPGRDVTIPVLVRWGSEFRNGQITDYGDLDQGDLEGYGRYTVTEDTNGNQYHLYTLPTIVRISSGAHQRAYGLQRIGTNPDADSRHETFTVMLDSNSPSWPAGLEPGSPASVRVTVRDANADHVPPGPPTDVWVWPGDQRLDVSWDPPSTGGSPTSYEVHYASRSGRQVWDHAPLVGDPSQGWAAADRGGLVATSTHHEITGMSHQTSYRVRVRAVNRSGNSAWAFGAGLTQAPEYDPHRDPTRATLGAIAVHYDGNPPVDNFRNWQPVRLANYGYRVKLPGEFSYLDPDDNSVRLALTTHAKLNISVGQPGSTLRLGRVSYHETDQSNAQATPPVACTPRPKDLMRGVPSPYWRCVALAAVTVGELTSAIELNAHSYNTLVDIEVTDGEVVRTWLLNIDPPPRTYSLSPRAQAEEGQDARLTLILGREAPAGGLEFRVTAAYGTARADDLGAVASPVIVPEGADALEIAVPTVDDDRYEGEEKFTVTVAPAGSGWAVDPEGTDTATVTIVDNDAAPEGPEPRAVQFMPGDGTLTVSWTVAPREGVEDGEIRHALRWSQTVGADHFWANPRDPRSVGRNDGITVDGGVTSYVITGLENGVATRVDLRSYTGSDHSEGSSRSSRWVTEEGEHTTPRGGEPQQPSPAARTYSVTAAARAAEGGAATVTVTLSEAAPQGGVEFSVTAGYSGGATATSDDVGSITSPVTVAQGNTTLDIAVPTAADAVDEDDETFTVTIAANTAGWEKAGDGRDTATVTIAADDTAGITVAAANPLSVAEGGSATYTVVLDSRPTANVTVTAASGDDGAATVSPASHTFTPSAWDTPLTFTVSGVADADTGDEQVAISHGVTSDDPRYAAVLPSTVSVSVSDTTADAPQGDQSPQAKFADFIANVKEWRNDPRYVDDKAHTDRWDRVLLAFGETVADTTLTAMTADEAQRYADRGWTRWATVPQALRDLRRLRNQAPTVSAALADVTIVSESGTRQVSLAGVFSDADNDVLTITEVSSDQAVATMLAATDQSSLTVSAHARGTATGTVTADDGWGGTVSDTFTITVKAAPTVASALADASGLEEGSTRDVSLSGVFRDADGDSLTITAASSDDAKATVSVAADQSKLTLTGVAEGTATITVTARDSDGNRVSDAFDVAVTQAPQLQQANRAPTVSSAIADGTIINESGTRQVSLLDVFSDADKDSLTITAASSAEAKATVSVSSDGSSLTVAAKSRGTATITVTAKDGRGGVVSDTFDVKVKAAPVVASALADISGLEVDATHEISLAGVFGDADGDSLTITAASSDDAVVAAYEFRGTLTIIAVAEGTETITVTAQDSDGNTVSDAFEVSVVKAPEPVNRPPTVASAIADATIVNERGTHEASLSGVFSDADNDSLTVTAASSDDAKATVSVASDYSALTVSAQARGTATVTVTADDGNGGTVSDTFTVTVKAAPVVASAIADVNGLEVDATEEVSLAGVFRDADGDSLTITAASDDEAIATVSMASDGSKLTLAGVAEGAAAITVTARDSDGNRVSDTFDVEVVEAAAETEGDGPPPVLNLRCIAKTDWVAFLWDAPEWSGGELYAYDYELTLPGGRSESGRLTSGTVLLRPGDYQQGDEASVSVRAVYELADGKEVSSAAKTLTCRVGE